MDLSRYHLRFLGLFASCALILLVGAFSLQAENDEDLGQATVSHVINDVFTIDDIRKDKPITERSKEGELLGPYHALRTAPKSRAELKFSDGSVARVGSDAMFSFSSEKREFQMGKGSAMFQVPKNSDETEIHTATATASLTGTTVMVGQQPGQSVKAIVVEGSMDLSMPDRAGESRSLESGQMVVMPTDANRIPEPVEVDLQELVNTSGLVNGFDDEEESEVTDDSEEATGQDQDGTQGDDNVTQEDEATQTTDDQAGGLDQDQMSEGIDNQQKEIESGDLERTNMVIDGEGTQLTIDEADETQGDLGTTSTNKEATEQSTEDDQLQKIIVEDGKFVQIFENGTTNELGGLETIQEVKETYDGVPIEKPQEVIVSDGNFVEIYQDGSTRVFGGLEMIDDLLATYQSVPIESPQEVIVSSGDFVEVYDDGSQRQLDSALAIADVYGTYQPLGIPVRPQLKVDDGNVFSTYTSASSPPAEINGFNGEVLSHPSMNPGDVSSERDFIQWYLQDQFGSGDAGLIQFDGIRLDGFPSYNQTSSLHGVLVSNGEVRFGNDPFEIDNASFSIGSTLDNYDWNLPTINSNGNWTLFVNAGKGSSIQFDQVNGAAQFRASARNSISITPGADMDANGFRWNVFNGSITTDNNIVESNGTLDFQGRTPSASISITNSTELRQLASSSVKLRTEGGEITVQNSKIGHYNGGFDRFDGQVVIETLNSSEDGTIRLKDAKLIADDVKVRAKGTNGLIEIGGPDPDPNLDRITTTYQPVKLYAPGSQSTIRFTNNTTLESAGDQIYIDANTIRIDNGVEVTADETKTHIYSDNDKYRTVTNSPGNVCGDNQCGKFIAGGNLADPANQGGTEGPQGGGPTF